jgi:hypothetical protein
LNFEPVRMSSDDIFPPRVRGRGRHHARARDLGAGPARADTMREMRQRGRR